MKTKAIIVSLASLVLGSSSIALASPSVTLSTTASGSYSTTVVRDHRVAAPSVVQPASWRNNSSNHGWRDRMYRPVTLASDLRFAQQGRTFITVGERMGRFQTLQISAGAGRTFIKQVYVQFENGQEQVIRNIDRTLARTQSLTVDLDGGRRAIRRIVVYGDDLNNGRNGWHRMGGTFHITAL
jgi:hypothetical protein